MKIMYQLRGSSTVMAVDGEVYMVIWDYAPHADKPGGFGRSRIYLSNDPLEAWAKYIETADMEIRRKIQKWKGARKDADHHMDHGASAGGAM